MPPRWGRGANSRYVGWLDGALIESGGPGSAIPSPFGDTPPLIDGILEVIRVRDGRCEFAASHIDRLITSAAALEIPLVFDAPELMDALCKVVRANPPGDLLLRLCAVRSVGGTRRKTGVGAAATAASMRIEATPFTGHTARPMSEGFRLATAPFPRNERSPFLRHKMLNDEEARLAIAFAREAGKDGAIFRNAAGRVVGATGANIHLVIDGTLATPSTEEGAFPGIVRGAVLRAARAIGLPAEERAIAPDELLRTPEVLLTSTVIGLAPVAEIDGVPLPPPTRRPVSPRLRIRFREIAAESGMIP